MPRRSLSPFIGCLSLLLTTLNAEPHRLADVKSSVEEVLHFHVDHNEFSQKLAMRSLRLFVERFDPQEIYLLEHEANPYVRPNPAKALAVVDQFHRGNFNEFIQLNKNIATAIHRSRKIRANLKTQILRMEKLPLETRGAFKAPLLEMRVTSQRDTKPS